MASLSRITNTFFVTLINRLGVRPPPPEGFEISNVVQPVSIVDVDTSLPITVTSPLLDLPFTAGVQANPGAAFVLADSGAQAAGNWVAYVELSWVDNVGTTQVSVQRRNAANGANIWEQQFMLSSAASGSQTLNRTYRIVLITSERLRVITISGTGAGSVFHANIWLSAS